MDYCGLSECLQDRLKNGKKTGGLADTDWSADWIGRRFSGRLADVAVCNENLLALNKKQLEQPHRSLFLR